MTLANVVPVAVPLELGEPRSVTVPAETHIMYWCRLCPIVPIPDLPDHEHQACRARIFRSLVDDVSAILTVDGEHVPLLDEIIRPDGVSEYGFWNITEPLSRGVHTAKITLAVEQDTDSPPPCVTYPDNAVVPWDQTYKPTGETTISVVEEDTETFQADSDPFWNRKDVYDPRRE